MVPPVRNADDLTCNVTSFGTASAGDLTSNVTSFGTASQRTSGTTCDVSSFCTGSETCFGTGSKVTDVRRLVGSEPGPQCEIAESEPGPDRHLTRPAPGPRQLVRYFFFSTLLVQVATSPSPPAQTSSSPTPSATATTPYLASQPTLNGYMAVRITNDELTYHMGIPTVKRSFDGPVHIPHIAESDVHPEWTIVLSVVVTLLCIYRTVRHIAKPGMKSNSGGVTEDSALMLGEGVFLRDDEDIHDWDARKYPKCRPFMGRKGTQFENFERDFGAAMAMDQDDDNDLEETMLGIDVGGDNSNTPATTLPQRRRRAKRLKNLYGHLYRHVADLRLREMMHAAARNDGRAAFQLLEQHCRRDITDLEMFDLNNEWETATFLNTEA